jgi:hypothetical protein
MNDRTTQYLEWYKSDVMTYDDVLKQVSKDIGSIMAKSSDELQSLKSAIDDESILKVKSQLDDAKSVLDSEADVAAKTARDQQLKLDMTTKLENNFKAIKSQVEGLPSFKTLSASEQKSVREFLENNKTKNMTILFEDTNSYIFRILNDPSRAKTIPLTDRKFLERIKILLSNPKTLLTYVASGAIILVIGLLLTGNIGAAREKFNENIKDWEKNNPDNPKEDEEKTTGCDKTLDDFKEYLKSQEFTETTVNSAIWDGKSCSGTITLGDNKKEPFSWNGSTFK